MAVGPRQREVASRVFPQDTTPAGHEDVQSLDFLRDEFFHLIRFSGVMLIMLTWRPKSTTCPKSMTCPKSTTCPKSMTLKRFLPLLALAVLVGCSEPASERASERASEPVGDLAANGPTDGETWEVIYMRGVRMGYGRSSIRHINQGGRDLLQIEEANHLAIQRFGQRTDMDMLVTSTETPEGELVELSCQIPQGSVPIKTVGRVVGGRLQLEVTSQGKTQSTSIPWKPEYGGPHAIEQSLRRSPMQPGEHRTLRQFAPDVNQLVTVEMTARSHQPVRMPEKTVDLLRIDTVTHYQDGQQLPIILFCNPEGDALASRVEGMDMEGYRTTKAKALMPINSTELDLGLDVAVPIDRPLPRPHRTQRIRYRVSIEGENAAEVFPSGPSQQVKPIDEHTAELTVYAIRPDTVQGNPQAPADSPTEDDLQPNQMVQSDDARITDMAEEAVGDRQDPWQVAVALENYVNRVITEKDFSQFFASAAEVAADPVGDCTEHAVLLAALARARGIPARAAIGLVYMPRNQAFGYHMWTELFIADRWIPMDGTLGQGGIGAAHLKLAHSSLKGGSGYSSFLPIIQVVGRLKIEVLEVQ